MDHQADRQVAKFSSVWFWATRDADKIREQCQSARFPQVDEYLNYIGESFGETHRLVLSAHAQESPIPPDSLAMIFARIMEFDRRAAVLVKNVPIMDWPGTPGCSLAQFSGRSGLEVAIAYSTAVRSGLQYTFNWIMTHNRFPRTIEEMPLTGDGMTESFRNWPERAYTELREKTIAAEPVWMMRREGERVWGAVVLEYERYVEQTLAHTTTSDRAARGEATQTTSPDGAMASRRSGGPSELPQFQSDSLHVDTKQQTLSLGNRSTRIGGSVAWDAFVLLYENRNRAVDLRERFGRSSRDVATDVRSLLRRNGFSDLAQRIVAQRGVGHVFEYP
ncbi:MAG: hypothetical protein ACKVS9_17995 [Phycisphaerae bacterium]